MIYYGNHGNISLFYNGILISNFPLSDKKQFKDYLFQGDYLIRESKGINIIQQIETYKKFCDIMYHRKINREAIYRSDHILFLSSLMALLRLKIIDNDDYNGFLIMPRKLFTL